MPRPVTRHLAFVLVALILLASGSARAEEKDQFSLSANASFAPKVLIAMGTVGLAFSYAPEPLYAFGGGIEIFGILSGDCSDACPKMPAGGQLITADAEVRPNLVGPLGAFIKGSAGVARATIGAHATTGHETWATARLSIGPELRGSHLLARVFVFETAIGRYTSPGFGLELGGTF